MGRRFDTPLPCRQPDSAATHYLLLVTALFSNLSGGGQQPIGEFSPNHLAPDELRRLGNPNGDRRRHASGRNHRGSSFYPPNVVDRLEGGGSAFPQLSRCCPPARL